MPAGRMNTGVGVSGESPLSQQSGTEATARRTKQNQASNSISVRRRDGHNHHHSQRAEASNVSRIHAGKDHRVAGYQPTGPAMMGRSWQPNSAGSSLQPPRPSPGQFNTSSRDALQVDARNDDKKKETFGVPGFDGGPCTVSARSRVQRETDAVPVPVPVNGSRPSPSFSIIEREGVDDISRRPQLYWEPQKPRQPRKRPKRNVSCRMETTDMFDVDKDALDAERQKKATALKKMSFSRKVKEEEVLASLRVDADADGSGDRRGSAGAGESREAPVGEVSAKGEAGGEKPPPRGEHFPWTRGNIPGLGATSNSARLHGLDVETKAVPIPLPPLFPTDSVSDLSDEEQYLPKEVGLAPQAQVKEEQREDEDVLIDSPTFPDLRTPIPDITIDLEQNAMSAHVDDTAAYPSDTDCTIHPKNKRKQHHAKNAQSPKKVKTDVGEGQSESTREVVRLQDEHGSTSEIPHESMPSAQKRRRSPKNKKGKETEKDQAETHTIRRQAPLPGGEDEMAICAVETKQGEITASDAMSLPDSQAENGKTVGRKESTREGGRSENAEQDEVVAEISVTPSTGFLLASASSGAISTVGLSDFRTELGETIGTKESESTGTGAKSKDPRHTEKNERTGVSIASTGPLLASTSVHDATRVKPSAPDSVTKRSGRKGKTKAKAPENGVGSIGEMPTEKRKVMGEQTQNHGVISVGDEGISHPDETPRRKRKVKDQATEGINCQGPEADAGAARDGEEPRPDEMPRKRTKLDDQTSRTQGGTAVDEHISQQEETLPDPTTKGGENIRGSSAGSAAADDIARPDETKGKVGRLPKKDDDDTNGDSSLVKVTEENGQTKEVKGKTRGRKKRATMDGKDGMTDSAVRKKKRVKLVLEEGGDRDRQSWKTVKSTVKWTLVCKNRTATGRKVSRQSKGKEKARSTATALDVDLDENEFKEGNVKTRKTLKPSVWASSKTELLLVLPELSGSKCFNGITEGSANFPMVMLDESTAEGIYVDVSWFDGEESSSSRGTPSVRLTLARDFVCPVAERANTAEIPMDSVAYTTLSDAGPSSDVMMRPNAPSSAAPAVLHAHGNAYRIDGPALPVVLPHDGTDLEYVDEDALQGGAAANLSVLPFNASPVVPYTPPVTQEETTTAHISHQMQIFSHAPALPTYHPVIQFNQHPSTVSIPSLHIQPFQHNQIPFPQHYTNPPGPIPIPTLQAPVDDEEPSPIPFELKSEHDTIIPPSPPPEVEILISSWKLSLPLVMISSRETFQRNFWAPLTSLPHSNSPEQAEKVGLASEHGYVFLGFFRVVKIGERRVALSDEERVDLKSGTMAGRVEWSFDVEWVPGYHGSTDSKESSRPWWAPDFVFDRLVGRERGSTWLEKHAQARLNLLPVQLVDGQEAGSSDEAMPKGWLCKACGKLNQKVMMRHRWCGSRMCRDNPLSRGYAVDLANARDANQTPLALPINTCNQRTVDARVADWDDGIRTLKYRPVPMPDRLGNTGKGSGILQHVFTCNLVDLQTEATPLFESIQSEVCLMKSTGDSGPLFKCHVSNSYANKRDKHAFSCLSWSEAPQAVRDAKDLMKFMGKYGEEETLDIDHLSIIGWVSSGTRKTPTILAAREHTIAMLCLGNDVVLTIVPRWEVSASVPEPHQVQQSLNLSYVPDAEMVNPAAPRVENFAPPKIQSLSTKTPRPMKPPSANQMQLVNVAAVPATEQEMDAIDENTSSGVVPAQIPSGNSRSKPLKPKSKPAPESMSVTLVHGDMLLFSGCEFEYSIKRMGTSILVIGRKEDSTASV